MIDIPWIRPSESPHNGEKIKELLEKVLDWRHGCGLGGQDSNYDFFHSCYGNPDSKLMIIAEIANLRGIHKTLNKEKVPEEMRWAIPWYVGDRHPMILRDALFDSGFIPPFCEHQPWKWQCWITNFVKIPETIKEWDNMSKVQKEPYISKSSEFLIEEIMTIKPHSIVLLGCKAQTYFRYRIKDQINKKIPNYRPTVGDRLNHYAAHESKIELLRSYRNEFRKIRKRLS